MRILFMLFMLISAPFFAQNKTWDKNPYYMDGQERLDKEFKRSLNYLVEN